MKPPTDRDKEIHAALMAEIEKNPQAPEADAKAKVAKKYGIEVGDLDMIVVKVMAYQI